MNEENLRKEVGFIDFIKKHKFLCAVYFFVTFFITFGLLYFFGFVPEDLKMTLGRYPTENTEQSKEIAQKGELPLRVKIDSVGVDAQIYNPNSTSTEILDEYLLKGAVHYPGSGFLGYGNVFLFGHSTGFRLVNNQAFKTFNGIKNLKPDDLISVFSDKEEFIYKVFSVKMITAEKVLVQFDSKSNKLTLSTCNTFGEKEDRYVVEADFYRKVKITN